MKRMLDFLKSIKLPSFGFVKGIHFPRLSIPRIRLGKPSWRSIVFWFVGIAAAVGLFVVAQGMTACWRLTGVSCASHTLTRVKCGEKKP